MSLTDEARAQHRKRRARSTICTVQALYDANPNLEAEVAKAIDDGLSMESIRAALAARRDKGEIDGSLPMSYTMRRHHFTAACTCGEPS